MQAFKPELILHLAAQPLVRRSYREPLRTFLVNAQGTAHVLEAARITGRRARSGLRDHGQGLSQQRMAVALSGK